MKRVLHRIQIFSTERRQRVSVFRLILTTIMHSLWLLSRSVKIIWILHKEMIEHILQPEKNRSNVMNRNIFQRYGMWFIDMNSLIDEQMGIR